MSELMLLVGAAVGWFIVGPIVNGPVMTVVDGIMGKIGGGGGAGGSGINIPTPQKPDLSNLGASIQAKVQSQIQQARGKVNSAVNTCTGGNCNQVKNQFNSNFGMVTVA